MNDNSKEPEPEGNGPRKGALVLVGFIVVALCAALAVGASIMTGIASVRLAPSPNGTSATNPPAGAPTTATAGATACVPGWRVVPSPDEGQYSVLDSVAAVSVNDVWAVGVYGDIHHDKTQPLIEHWNGVSWAVVPSPNPEPSSLSLPVTYTPLRSGAAVSANDVWAVGSFDTNDSHLTLVGHWNGRSWAIVASPNPAAPVSFLDGVAVVSRDDVWAVGSFSGSIGDQSLIEHWSGASWTLVPSPSQGRFASLDAVGGVSANDVWAVGYYFDTDGSDWALIEHWDGTSWTVSTYPKLGLRGNLLNGVAAVSANDAWAVGRQIEHWNGASWSTVSNPEQGSSDSTLNGVAAASANDVWAVGSSTGSNGHSYKLIEHWDGASWSIVISPNRLSSGLPSDDYLQGVAALSANDIWVVGGSTDSSGYGHTLIEHLKPCPGNQTPTP